uniref:Uncharacterized protein n=1 Tax=Lotharella globosa TaxID=91324 RepID=A0A7S4DYP5_9EUKA
MGDTSRCIQEPLVLKISLQLELPHRVPILKGDLGFLLRLRGGDSSDEDSDDSEQDKRRRRRKKKDKSPEQKLEKYKKLVKKLEDAKQRLEARHSRVLLAIKDHRIKEAKMREELDEAIEAEKNTSRGLNETLKQAEQRIEDYLVETPKRLNNSVKYLQEYLSELQSTMSKLMKRKFELLELRAQQDAQKDNVALRAKIILLERKIATQQQQIATAGVTELGGWELNVQDTQDQMKPMEELGNR